MRYLSSHECHNLYSVSDTNAILPQFDRFGVNPVLADILTDAQMEKVSEIVLAVFRVSDQRVIFPRFPLLNYLEIELFPF